MGPRRRTGRPAPPRPLLLLLLLALSLVLRGADGTVTVTGTGRQYHSRPASFGYEMEYGAFLVGLMLAEGRLIGTDTVFLFLYVPTRARTLLYVPTTPRLALDVGLSEPRPFAGNSSLPCDYFGRLGFGIS